MAGTGLTVCLRQMLSRGVVRQISALPKMRSPCYSRVDVNLSRSGWVYCSRSYTQNSQRVENIDEMSAVDGAASDSPLALSSSERLKSLSPELEKKFKVIQLEYQVYEQMGISVPETMTDNLWLKALECDTKSARRRLYIYLRSLEKHSLAAKRKKVLRLQHLEETAKAVERDDAPKSPLNTIFLQIRAQTMLKHQNSKLANAMMYGYPLVIDLGYEEFMNQREITNMVDQLLQSHGFNKLHKEPFHFVFCNVRKNCATLNRLQAATEHTPLDKYMITITEKSYLDMYPRKKLVYLSPNAPNVMENYDDDKIYIVGGFVDKSNPQPLSRAKAKQEGIAMAKLPLDYFHKWSQGSKSLTLDQMTRILLDLQMTRDWYKALRHVPTRKIVGEDQGYGKIF